MCAFGYWCELRRESGTVAPNEDGTRVGKAALRAAAPIASVMGRDRVVVRDREAGSRDSIHARPARHHGTAPPR